MPTSSGKTLVANHVIQELLKGSSRYRALVVVCTIQLVRQQGRYFRRRAGRVLNASVEEMCGEVVRGWHESTWQGLAQSSRLIVGTASVMLRALQDGHMPIEDLRVVVLDECHNASGNHSMRLFASALTDRLGDRRDEVRIVGLTASYVHGKLDDLEGKKQLLESLLHARMYVPNIGSEYQQTFEFTRMHPEELVTAVTKEDILQFIAKQVCGEDSAAVEPCDGGGSASSDCSDDETASRSSFDSLCSGRWSQPAAAAVSLVKPKEVQKIAGYGYETLIALGRTAFLLWWREDVHERYKERAFQKEVEHDRERDAVRQQELADEVRMYKVIQERLTRSGSAELIPGLQETAALSDKVHKLREIFVKQREQCRMGGKEYRGIIFVERRVTAFVLSKLLNREMAEIGIKSVPLAGRAGMTDSVREANLSRFRTGEVNTMVATNAAEEGFDIPGSNCVVRFDKFHVSRSHIQGKGRARSRDASVYYFCNSPELEEQKASVMQAAAMKPGARRKHAEVTRDQLPGYWQDVVNRYCQFCFRPRAVPSLFQCNEQRRRVALWWPSPEGWQEASFEDARRVGGDPPRGLRGYKQEESMGHWERKAFSHAAATRMLEMDLLEARGEKLEIKPWVVRYFQENPIAQCPAEIEAQIADSLAPQHERTAVSGRQSTVASTGRIAREGRDGGRALLQSELHKNHNAALSAVCDFTVRQVQGGPGSNCAAAWQCLASFKGDPDSRVVGGHAEGLPSKTLAQNCAAEQLLRYYRKKRAEDPHYRPRC
eukprot:TRINITY_DN2802_c3_g1_i3.p1 TRINITY_DN2802_c3_g1~~TRINITY_DN2802_c3_g1_i3.p1  ORF type:complete len:773 (+),score=258.05 TRINITY_DN2802_c3_g1_i3:628-2946(+)